jgi:hypothetical protein
MLTTVNDKLILKYKGHYYGRAPYLKNRWRCVNTNSCYVALLTDDNFRVRKEPQSHNHPPKTFVKTDDGRYKLLKDVSTKFYEFRTLSWSGQIS